MSIQLFRKDEQGDIESALFDPESFEHNLGDGGYVLDPKELEEEVIEHKCGEVGLALMEEKPAPKKRGRKPKAK